MISAAARRLIAEHIISVEQLEVLLLLRESSDRVWTAAEIEARIRSSLVAVTSRLDDLIARGFLLREGDTFRYAAHGEIADAISDLAQAYAQSPFTVIELIFRRSPSQSNH